MHESGSYQFDSISSIFTAWMELLVGTGFISIAVKFEGVSSLQLRYIAAGERGDPRLHDLQDRP